MLKSNALKNQNGTAMVEVVPLLVIFVLLINFALGFFGVIHAGILNSIAARNYAFETFRNRAVLNYLRDISDSDDVTYRREGFRFHGIKKEGVRGSEWVATTRPIKFTDTNQLDDPLGSQSDHNQGLRRIAEGQRVSDAGLEDGVNPVWVRTMYGICLNAKCSR
jgi:hypothetical protein